MIKGFDNLIEKITELGKDDLIKICGELEKVLVIASTLLIIKLVSSHKDHDDCDKGDAKFLADGCIESFARNIRSNVETNCLINSLKYGESQSDTNKSTYEQILREMKNDL